MRYLILQIPFNNALVIVGLNNKSPSIRLIGLLPEQSFSKKGKKF